jgi:hypothetical protein
MELLLLLLLRKRRHHLYTLFFSFKSIVTLNPALAPRVATRNVRDFPLFGVCPYNKHCSSAW